MAVAASWSLRSRLLVTALVAGSLGLVACGSGEGDSGTGEGEATVPPQIAIQTQSGFNPQEIYEEASPGVVTIRSVFGSESALGGGGQGSGFVITTDGEIVTNAHVVTDADASGGDDVKQAEEVYVEFSDRNQVPAEIVGFDLNADVALLKINRSKLGLQPLELGDSSAVPVGTPVAAIGSPFGQEQSISVGIVSATDRAIESLTDFRIDGAIQTDASINPGNSGGPLIDPEGKVIGINQQINTTSGGNEGVGFAVPSNLVQRSIDDLRDDGKAEYAFIGVTSIPLYPQLAIKLGLDAPTGSLIVSTEPDSPAEAAGLEGAGSQTVDFQGREIEVGGDVIVAVDGKDLVGENDLARFISESRPGDTIEIEVIRDGDRKKIEVTLKARPNSISG